MALDLVTGYKGQNHVTAEQWADFNRGIYGDAAILPIGSKMQVEIQTANQITVKDGTGVFDGRQVYIGYGESENIAIESGTQQMLRHDIVVIKYTKDETSGVENVAFEVITGTPVASDPTDPSYQDMDIRTGVFTSQKPFCRVRLNGVAIEGVDMLVEVKEFADHAFEPLAENLTTSEPGRALDATMGKQLKESMDELEDDVSELTQNMNTYDTQTIESFSGNVISSGSIRIEKKNGWCHINGRLVLDDTIADSTQILSGIPKPKNGALNMTVMSTSITFARALYIGISSDGVMSARWGSANTHYIDISYCYIE